MWCALINVKPYTMIWIPGNETILTIKEGTGVQKLLAAKPAKTAKQLAYEEYQRQLELAIENH
jgi:hypothetical protein